MVNICLFFPPPMRGAGLFLQSVCKDTAFFRIMQTIGRKSVKILQTAIRTRYPVADSLSQNNRHTTPTMLTCAVDVVWQDDPET